MTPFEPIDPAHEARIRDGFCSQKVMETIGAEIVHIAAGCVRIKLPFNGNLTQQHGFLHAGIVTTVVDSACGFAAYTLMPAESGVLTIEYKVNFLSPAVGDYMLATGQVIKAGRTITVCEGRVMAYQNDSEKLIVTMQATMMCLQPSG